MAKKINQPGITPGLQKLHDTLTGLGFVQVPAEEKLSFVLTDGVSKPSRANAGNALQRQYRYTDGLYCVYIHTGTLDQGEFSDRGSAWVMITHDGKRLITREFYRNRSTGVITMFEKILAYAKYFKGIILSAKNREIVEIANVFFYKRKTNKQKINPSIIQHVVLTKNERGMINKKENERNYYFKKTAQTVSRRERETRSQWK